MIEKSAGMRDNNVIEIVRKEEQTYETYSSRNRLVDRL